MKKFMSFTFKPSKETVLIVFSIFIFCGFFIIVRFFAYSSQSTELASYFFQKGNYYLHTRHEPEKALENYKKSLVYYKDPKVLYAVGGIYEQKNNSDEAIKNYKQAIQYDPYYWEAFLRLASLEFNVHSNTHQAKIYIQKTYEIQPKNPHVIYLYALILLEEGDKQEAKKLTQDLLDSEETITIDEKLLQLIENHE